jgi:hypothetical protein
MAIAIARGGEKREQLALKLVGISFFVLAAYGDSQLLFRDADDFTEMFVLLDRVEHECRDCFARNRESHLGSSAVAASIRRVIFPSETRRADYCPIDPVVTHSRSRERRDWQRLGG